MAGGPAFDLVDTTKTVGAPLFALFEGRVPRAPTAKDSASHPHDTRSRNEISPHPTFNLHQPCFSQQIAPITAPPPLLWRFHQPTFHRIAIHASESSETRIGGVSGVMALEQLSILSSGRSWACERKRRLGRNFVSGRGGLRSKSLAVGSIVPALAKNARTGHPQ
jgi:hypothetical protein